MLDYLHKKHIVLGVTGGIAAYKSVDLIRKLRDAGATVRVVMTEHAKAFVTPLTFQAISGFPVSDDLFDPAAEAAMGHIALARWADLILIAPTTTNFMAKLAMGLADDLLSTICLATTAPIAIIPSMNQMMWQNVQTQNNLRTLIQNKIHVFGPEDGSQACGEIGPGRMLEPTDIIQQLGSIFLPQLLKNQRVIITAGPTREYIDAVRYISNPSSGQMGYALAEAAIASGAKVTLISGPVALPKLKQATHIDVTSATEMHQAVLSHLKECDIFIGVAAVSDYRPKTHFESKIPKKNIDLNINLTLNPDIISIVGSSNPRPFVVGFAAETEQLLEKARTKLKNKHLDLIVANLVSNEQGFEQPNNTVTVLTHTAEHALPCMPKQQLAHQLIAIIAKEASNYGRKHCDTSTSFANTSPSDPSSCSN